MNEGMPTIILTVTVSLLILGVGLFAFFYVTMNTNQNINLQRTDTFNVADPSQDQTFTLSGNPDRTTLVVTQYTGFEWIPVSSAHIRINDNIATVDADGLLG